MGTEFLAQVAVITMLILLGFWLGYKIGRVSASLDAARRGLPKGADDADED